MSITISRKLAGVYRLKDLLNELLMPKELHVPASRVIQDSRGYGQAFSVFLF